MRRFPCPFFSFPQSNRTVFFSGFTLIEILVVVTIMGVVLGGSIAGYTQFNERQQLVSNGKELLTNIRQAQAKASSGVKSNAGCQTLQGYAITASAGASSYTVSLVCSNATFAIQTYQLASGVTVQSAVSLTFQGQLGGVLGITGTSTDIVLSKSSLTYTITVNQSGGINDVGVQ